MATVNRRNAIAFREAFTIPVRHTSWASFPTTNAGCVSLLQHDAKEHLDAVEAGHIVEISDTLVFRS